MIRRKMLSFVVLNTFFLALAPTVGSADDFAPPPWDRSDPFAVTAEWEFATPANPTLPDGPLTNVLTKGSGSAPTTATVSGFSGLGWGPGDGDGGWFFPAGGLIFFEMDNIIDRRPLKHLWMQVTHAPMLGLEVDPLATFNVPATGSTPGPVFVREESPTSTILYWEMFPNPPYEHFLLRVFGAGEIDQVVVDTISIPEPATFALCAGLLSLGLARQRRYRQRI